MVENGKPAIAVLFKGQGIHYPGMAKSLVEESPAAREVFNRVEDVLSLPLAAIVNGESVEALDAHAQVATVTTELALFAALIEQVGELSGLITVFFGSSLGQFAAYADRVISLEDTARLLDTRQTLTRRSQEKRPKERPGGMLAVIGVEEEALNEVLGEQEELLVVGNHNFSNFHVVSGDMGQEGRLSQSLKQRGAKRVVRLGIPYASHSRLMQDISDEFSGAIKDVPFAEATTHILIPNESAKPTRSGAEVKKLLPTHLTDPVHLDQTWQQIQSEKIATVILEIGPGNPVFVSHFKRYKEITLAGLHVADMKDIQRIGEEITVYAGVA